MERVRHDDRGHGQTARIVDWTDPKETISAAFDLIRAGTFDVQVTYAASLRTAAAKPRPGQERTDGSGFRIEVDDQRLECQVVGTGGDERFRSFNVGRVHIEEPGRHSLLIRPEPEGWPGIGLQSIELMPVSD